MFKIHPLRYKLPRKEPDFTLFSPRSAAMRLKNRFVRTLSEQFSLAKTKFKHDLNKDSVDKALGRFGPKFMKVDWNRAVEKKISLGKAVVAPLVFEGNLYASFGKNKRKSALNRSAFLYMYKDADGNMHTEVVRYIADDAHVPSTRKSWLGLVLVEDIEGNFLAGYRFEENRITPLTRTSSSAQVAKNLMASGATETCFTTTYYSCSSNDCSVVGVDRYCYNNGGNTRLTRAPDYDDGGEGGDPYTGGGSGGGSSSSGEMFVVSIDDSKLAPCMQPIMGDLTSLTKGVGQIVAKFAGSTPGFNWEVKDGPLGGATGQTSQNYNRTTGTVTTTFDSNQFTNASDLSVARTILHESVHAYILAFLRTDYPNAEQTFADMLKDYYDNIYPNSNDAHHNEIARNYVDDIALALQEYGSMQGYSLSTQFYQDLAWGGLTHWAKRDASGNVIKDSSGNTLYEETPWFKTAYPNATDRARVNNVIIIELTGKDANGNAKTKEGDNVGC